jgi:hypothetical protein
MMKKIGITLRLYYISLKKYYHHERQSLLKMKLLITFDPVEVVNGSSSIIRELNMKGVAIDLWEAIRFRPLAEIRNPKKTAAIGGTLDLLAARNAAPATMLARFVRI